MNNLKLISGTSNISLAENIANNLEMSLAEVENKKFANGELFFKIKDNVRNHNVYFINTGYNCESMSINDYLIETLLGCEACAGSSAKSICLIIPFYPYSRSDKKGDGRIAIGASMLGRLIENVGVNRIVSMDLHAGQIQGFSRLPFDNLYIKPLFIKYLINNYFKGKNPNENYILVAPDAGSCKRTESYAETLQMNYIGLHKQRDYTTQNQVKQSKMIGSKEDIQNKTCIVIDDMIDTAGTIVAAINELGENGAKDVVVMATHGILSGPAIDRINECEYIREVIITNSLPQEDNLSRCDKLTIIDIAPLLARVIQILETGGSISELFI